MILAKLVTRHIYKANNANEMYTVKYECTDVNNKLVIHSSPQQWFLLPT